MMSRTSWHFGYASVFETGLAGRGGPPGLHKALAQQPGFAPGPTSPTAPLLVLPACKRLQLHHALLQTKTH